MRISDWSSDVCSSDLQTVAMISLLLEGWFEPPAVNGQHLSTLVMQMLSHVAQCGGAGIGPLYTTLCSQQAPFASIAKDEFAALVRHFGRKRLLMEDGGGDLLLGEVGEKIVNHSSF